MNPKQSRPYRRFSLAALLLLAAPGVAQAAIYTEQYTNTHAVDGIYLALKRGTIDGVDFRAGAMSDWASIALSANEAFLTGPRVAATTGLFDVRIDARRANYRIEWAEVVWNANVAEIQSSGTLRYRNGVLRNTNRRFSQTAAVAALTPPAAPVPVPASVVLFSSAMASTLAGRALLSRRAAR